MQRLLVFSVRHPKWVVVLSVALAALAALFIPRIELRLDGRSLIPRDHPSMAASDAAAERFEVRDMVVLGVDGGDDGVWVPPALSVLGALSDELAAAEGVIASTVASLATTPGCSTAWIGCWNVNMPRSSSTFARRPMVSTSRMKSSWIPWA